MQSSSSETGCRILVIDDTPEIHDDFRKILCGGAQTDPKLEAAEAVMFGQGDTAVPHIRFEVDSAFQGHHGLAKVFHALDAGSPYAMVFLDVRMPPGWDGIELAPRLWLADPNLFVVICTAFADYSWEKIFEKIGASDQMFFLKKPFDRTEVMQLAYNLTRKWVSRRAARLRHKHLEKSLAGRDALSREVSDKIHAEIMRLLPDGKKAD